MLIESRTEWTLNQSYEVKVMNSLSTPRPKTKDEHCWYFVPCINIKEKEDTYAFNRILVQHGAKLKWETRRMGWCWFPSLNVYEMTPVFFPLVLNHFSVEWKLFSKVYEPLMKVVQQGSWPTNVNFQCDFWKLLLEVRECTSFGRIWLLLLLDL
jgi:hypothetical protein